ncbi:MAG: hypothetical protein ACRDHZ_18775 [Ktedonobacteraceae bacterium]
MACQKLQHTPAPFAFTPAMIRITQDALTLFAQSLQRVAHPDAKTAFATATMQQVKEKLDTLSQTCQAHYLTTFDYNEKIIIATAIQLYTLDVLVTPTYPQHDLILEMCRQIACFARGKLS